MAITNESQATGGEDSPSIEDLKALVPATKNSQERIVTKEDLLSRIYTLPANFGRVFRAAVKSNPNNPLATQLYIVCRNSESKLTNAPDTLKENLKKYLNPYRLINDAIDILDSPIVNLSFNFDIVVDPSLNQQTVLQSILNLLITQFQTTKFSIDQPIVISDIQNTIFSVPGVLSIVNTEFKSMNGLVNNRQYSNIAFDPKLNYRRGILYPPDGGIFEIRYPEVDIVGRTAM